MTPRPSNPVPFLRRITWLEGISFLLLLGVAMPLKYLADLPLAVRVVGLLHGVLFMIVIVALVRTMRIARWPLGRGVLVLVAALLPFGPFLFDRRLQQYSADFESSRH
jgi:integral membrane protein